MAILMFQKKTAASIGSANTVMMIFFMDFYGYFGIFMMTGWGSVS